MGQSQLTLFRFFGQNMTLESVLSFDFTRPSQLETLLGAGLCFLLRHFFLFNYYLT